MSIRIRKLVPVSFWLLWAILGAGLSARAQTTDWTNISLPQLYRGQHVRALVYLGWKNNADTTWWQSRPFFVVQNHQSHAFALVDAIEKKWVKATPGQDITLVAVPDTLMSSGIVFLSDKHLFEFTLPKSNTLASASASVREYGIHCFATPGSSTSGELFMFVNNWQLAGSVTTLRCDSKSVITGLPAASTKPVLLIKLARKIGDDFIPVPFQSSAKYTSTTTSLADATRLVRNTSSSWTAPVSKCSDAVLSLRGQVLLDNYGTVKEDLLKVRFKGTAAEIGWVSYEKTNLSQSGINTYGGSCRPRVGVGIRDNTVYFLIDGVERTDATFTKAAPIYIGIGNGALYFEQRSGTTVTASRSFTHVPINSILSTGVGSKAELMATVKPLDTLEVGYSVRKWVFLKADVGTDLPSFYSTSSDLSIRPSGNITYNIPKPTNQFDWRSETYKLRYKANGSVVPEEVMSPFFSNDPAMASISHKTSAATLAFAGGADDTPYEGWELITANLGYKNDGTPIADASLLSEPYLILYNRFQGTLRIFVYLNNQSVANNYRVTLKPISMPRYGGASTKYKPAFLWSSFLQGYALDDARLSIADYSKSKAMSSSGSGKFYYADFTMAFDPCVSFFESAIQVSVDKVTQGDMTIVGRTQGGVIPANSPAIGDWMANSNNYLTGVLATPYGSLANTMGDITFNNYNAWGKTEWKNTAQFVLPGKKIEQWEKEAAQLEIEGLDLQSKAKASGATGTIMNAIGEVGGPFGGIAKAIGAMMEVDGQIKEGRGIASQAKAARLRYQNMQDEPDQNIEVRLPEPQPSIVFSELSAKGTLSIQTSVFNNLKFTTPGSQNANRAPEMQISGTKGNFPYYNQPLGVFNMLYKPQFAIAVGQDTNGSFRALLRFKEWPYIALNRIAGVQDVLLVANLQTSTFNSDGTWSDGGASASYLLTKSATDAPVELRLPEVVDITDLIDWSTIMSNIANQPGPDADIASKLKTWMEIGLRVNCRMMGQKAADGSYFGSTYEINFNGENALVSYQSNIPAASLESTVSTNSSSFISSGYTRADNPLWGSNHVITDDDVAFETSMNSYCNSVQSGKIDPNMPSAREAAVDSLDSEDVPSELEKEVNADETSSSREIVEVWPNPTKGLCTIKYNALVKGDVVLELSDLTGRLVSHVDYASQDGESKQSVIDFSGAKPGVYILKIAFADGRVLTERIIKR